MNLPTVIAICGPAGAGKSTVANHLVEKYGAVRFGFATPLKEMVKRALDFTDEQVYGTQEQKEAVDPRYGKSPRWFLQRIGTEGCRAVFGEDFWTKQALDAIVRSGAALVVIDDMRFINEAEAVLFDPRVNGFVWRLWPVGDAETQIRALAAGLHPSEGEWCELPATLEIKPDVRGIPELLALVDAAMARGLRADFREEPTASARPTPDAFEDDPTREWAREAQNSWPTNNRMKDNGGF